MRSPGELLYRALSPVRPGRMLPGPLAHRLRRQIVGMPAEEVLAALGALEGAGVPAVVCGGWGIDALLGRQTRRHADLDLLVQWSTTRAATVEALGGIGYRVVDEAAVGGHWAPQVTVLRNEAGRIIELLTAIEPGTVTTGTVGGQPVVCVTAEQQLEYHRGYRHTTHDRVDVARLADHLGVGPEVVTPRSFPRPKELAAAARRVADRLRSRPSSALVVVVPEAEPAVADWRRRADPSAARGVPAHVTVLYPFLPPHRLTADVRARLATLAATVPARAFSLTEVKRFPGVTYLAPDTDEPFLDLLAAVQTQWPGLEPYGGRFDSVIPHLTVVDGTEPAGLEPALSAALPIAAVAEALTLLVEGPDGRWSVDSRFDLGRP